MKKIPLRVTSTRPSADVVDGVRTDGPEASAQAYEDLAGEGAQEGGAGRVLGWLAVIAGLLGVFSPFSFVFVPLTFVISIAALIAGEVMWAFLGLLLGAVGFFTSPVLLSLTGLGFLIAVLGL